MVSDFSLLIAGLFCLILGSHFLIDSLKSLSSYFKLSPLFLSIVVLGFISSAPEWFVTMNASLKNLPSAALGNILGSNVINILLILALSGLFHKFSWNRQIVYFDMIFLIVGVLLLGLFSIHQRITAVEGLCLLGFFCLYIILLFKKRKGSQLEKPSTDKFFSLYKCSGIFFSGFLLLFLGSHLAVDSSLNIIKTLSLSERFAGVFILSLSTSLPELATSLQAGLKKEGEMALGNIIGSNVFNTLFVLGSACLLNPLYFELSLYYDYFFMLIITLILFLSLWVFKALPQWMCFAFILSYFIYIVFGL